jgi:hypothetical protein
MGDGMNTARQAMENMEYVRRLLEEKQAGFAASVELAVSFVHLVGDGLELADLPAAFTTTMVPDAKVLHERPLRRGVL